MKSKAIIFCFNFVLAIVYSGYSKTLEAMPPNDHGNVQKESLLTPNTSQSESRNFYVSLLSEDIWLLDEDNEDVNNSARNKFSFKQSAFTKILFNSHISFDNFSKRFWSTGYFINFCQHSFISLRVLRL